MVDACQRSSDDLYVADCNAGSNQQAALYLASAPQVTFYGDLLPILTSAEAGKVYKCTTCHADYSKPDGLNNVPEINRLINSMKSGRMPRGGTKVADDQIQLFRLWQLQGFKPGSPSQRGAEQLPSTGAEKSGSAGTTAGTEQPAGCS